MTYSSECMRYFNPEIPGLDGILCNKKGECGFAYYDSLNMVVHGPAGSGKSLFALQCAMGAVKSGRHVVYLSKDTRPKTLHSRLHEVFNCFDLFREVKVSQPETDAELAGRTLPLMETLQDLADQKKYTLTELRDLCRSFGQVFRGDMQDNSGKATPRYWYFIDLDKLADHLDAGKLGVGGAEAHY